MTQNTVPNSDLRGDNIPINARLHTDRTILRAPQKKDFAAILSASSSAGFNEGMTWDPPKSTRDLEIPHRQFISDWHTQTSFVWTMEDKNSGAIIGRFAIRCEDSLKAIWSIGYWVHPELQGRGFATEGARELLKLGFGHLRAKKIWASTATWNRASAKVLKNIGMAYAREKGQGFLKQGVWGRRTHL